MGDQTGTYRIRYEGAKAITYVRSMQNTNQVWSGEVSSNELAFEVKPPSPASIRKAFHTLSDEDASTESKLRAIEVLKLRQDEAVIRTMTNLVAGTNTVVGLAALGVLDRIRSPEFFDIFVSCLTRPDPQMQCLAFWAIGEYPESRKKKLTKMLAEEYKRGPARKSHFALLALARYGDESTLTILEEIAAKYKDEFIQRDVQKRINKIKAEQQERQRQGP
jgi:HEAT repeat protein